MIERSAVRVSFLGPFLRYSQEALEMPFEEGMTLFGTIEQVGVTVGKDFRERALEATTTVILNNTILNWAEREDVVLKPGDNVTFALLLGGG